MKAIVYKDALPIDHADALLDVELPDPEPGPMDVLVKVEAVSVNPVDTKIRMNVQPEGARVLGWDAVGTIVSVGNAVETFKPGQRVWYAGALNRPGTNSALHCVDARIISLAPESLSSTEAAALPLTAITAWEVLFERLKIPQGDAPSDTILLISGAAGGVGSIMVQLAAKLTTATIVATTGRQDSREWVKSLGADHVIDYREPLAPQLAELGISAVTHIASLTHTASYFAEFVEVMAPFGHLALIDDPETLDVTPMKVRSLSLHWEMMFTHSLFQTPTMASQGELLARVAKLVDDGAIQTTVHNDFGTINAKNLRRAHALIEQGKARGKIVLSGFTVE